MQAAASYVSAAAVGRRSAAHLSSINARGGGQLHLHLQVGLKSTAELRFGVDRPQTAG